MQKMTVLGSEAGYDTYAHLICSVFDVMVVLVSTCKVEHLNTSVARHMKELSPRRRLTNVATAALLEKMNACRIRQHPP